jgi:hypothetical protein
MGQMGLDLIYRGRHLKAFAYVKKRLFFQRHTYINQFDNDTSKTSGWTDVSLRSLPHTSLV